MKVTRKLDLIVEKQDNHLWGRVEDEKSSFMPTGQGETIDELIKNVKESIEDYVEHEGENDEMWNKLVLADISFDIKYDLQAFFKVFSYLNLSEIAKLADINRSLLNQYTAGIKYPSIDQARKIERVVHKIAKEMEKVSIYAA